MASPKKIPSQSPPLPRLYLATPILADVAPVATQLPALVAEFGIKGLTEDDLRHINFGWHRLKPWPDSVPGLTRLKRKFIIGPLSNGNVALLTKMAKNAGIPWDVVFGSDLFGHFKPDPETYLGAARLLDLTQEQALMEQTVAYWHRWLSIVRAGQR